MQDANIPSKFPVPFGNSAVAGDIRPIPLTTSDPNAASLQGGFPPTTFTPVGAGGAPPDGRDFNGILNIVTAWLQWTQAGGPIGYDGSFSTSIGGYPKGAVIAAANFGYYWLSLSDNNTTDPDTGGANWLGFTVGNRFAVDSGSANAYVGTFVPAYQARVAGSTFRLKVANLNTGASTFTPGGGLGASLLAADGSALVGGEMVVGRTVNILDDGTNYQILGEVNGGRLITGGGWIRLAGGFMAQWNTGVTTTGNQDLITFPVAFPNACFGVVALESNAQGGGGWTSSGPTIFGTDTRTVTNFKMSCMEVAYTGVPHFAGGIQYTYLAFGF